MLPILISMLRIIIIGDAETGKSSIFRRLAGGNFVPEYSPTIGLDFWNCSAMYVRDQIIQLQVWDTAGQDRYRGFKLSYYTKAVGIILTYDVTHRESFNSLTKWLNEASEHCRQDLSVMLVGNKSDLETHRTVSSEEGMQFAKDHNLLFMEASAREYLNIDTALQLLAHHICSRTHHLID
jgi:small GTP-binding protein